MKIRDVIVFLLFICLLIILFWDEQLKELLGKNGTNLFYIIYIIIWTVILYINKKNKKKQRHE